MEAKSLEAVLADLIGKMGVVAGRGIPEALGLTCRYYAIWAGFWIVLGLVLLCAAGTWLTFAVATFRREPEEYRREAFATVSVLVGLIALVPGIPGLLLVLNPNNWMLLLEPRLALVQLAMQAAGK